MKYLLKPLIIFVLIFLLCKCEHSDCRLNIRNSSASIVYLQWLSDTTDLKWLLNFNKVFYINNKHDTLWNLERFVKPNGIIDVCTRNTWEENFNENPTKKLYFYFIDSISYINSFKNGGVPTIKMFTRYDLSLKDIKQMNWTIKFQK